MFKINFPKKKYLKRIVAVLIGWFALIIFVGLFMQAPQTCPEYPGSYPYLCLDNNHFATTLLGGWLLPLITVIGVIGYGAVASLEAPNQSLQPTANAVG